MTLASPRVREVEYPESDSTAETELERGVSVLLEMLVRRLFRMRMEERRAHVGGNQFFYWREGDPKARRAPDVYVVDGVAQDIPEVSVWKTWEGHHPRFALEVASHRWQKDYDEVLPHYDAMGVEEVVIFDPGANERSRRRVTWQHFYRTGDNLQRIAVTEKDRLYVRCFDAWLVDTAVDGRRRLRVGLGPHGETMLPTPDEEATALSAVIQERDRLAMEIEQLRRAAGR